MSESSSAALSVGRGRLNGERLAREFEQSRMTRKVFCRVHGISVHTLDYYRHKHGSHKQRSGGQLVPVQLVGPLPAKGSHLRVELSNGRRISVEEGFDVLLLKRLIAALEG
ncbi:MAG: hypothetical protein WB561_22750 [Terracidiphilus sp.]